MVLGIVRLLTLLTSVLTTLLPVVIVIVISISVMVVICSVSIVIRFPDMLIAHVGENSCKHRTGRGFPACGSTLEFASVPKLSKSYVDIGTVRRGREVAHIPRPLVCHEPFVSGNSAIRVAGICNAVPQNAGVIDLGKAETRNLRQYRVLRIPKAVVEKYLADKSGPPIQIQVPERAERRRRSPKWEDRAIINLAKAGLQNGATNKADEKTYRRIADLAAFLARAVPESEWADIGWLDEEE
jgi:hypothetical protein